MKLFDDQSVMVDKIYAAWEDNTNVQAVMPTGSGKTVVFSHIINGMGLPTCAIAHRKELVGQMAMALARYGVHHRVVGPTSLVKQVVHEQVTELGCSFYNPNAKVAVAGVDTLIRRGGDLSAWMNQVRLWVIDECFPAGTLVDGRPIESIQVGDVVTAFNERTGAIHGRKVQRLFKNPIPDEMVTITAGHHVVECTKGHPFWTQRGWVNAGEITRNDRLYVVRSIDHADERRSAVQVAQDRSDILSEEMRSSVSGSPQGTPHSTRVASDPMHDVSSTSGPDWLSTCAMAQDGSGVLQFIVRKLVSFTGVIKDNASNKSDPCVRQNETEKPNAQRADSHQGVEHSEADEPSAKTKRRQRAATDSSGNRVVRDALRSWFYVTGDRANRSLSRWLRLSDALQNRLRQSLTQNGDRSGRVESQCDQAQGAGPQEDGVFEWVGVDDVEIYKPADTGRTGDGFVYNIEVDEFHTYIANDIVVHNCHHVVRGNKWGTAVEMFPNARGLGVTATPLRADGKGLGRHADGVMDVMVEGLNMRQLIDIGRLTDYRIFAPPSDIDLTSVPVTQSGEFSAKPLKTAVRSSHIVGDVVDHYLRIAKGKLGVTFATDVETATDIARQFKAAGVPAEVVSAKTPDRLRNDIIRKFRAGEILQLVNVDLFGEGFDLPAVEVVSMARPTQSYGLYCQQFGRVLRIMAGKEYGIVIDHVGNVVRHGLPDKARIWSLDSREKRPRAVRLEDEIPLMSCAECTMPYEKVLTHCPNCGHKPVPASRGAPEFVDGDLYELDPSVLAEMRGKIELVDNPSIMLGRMARAGAPRAAINGYRKNSLARIDAQAALRESITWWGTHHRNAGKTDSESYRLFYHFFGIDILSAQALGKPEALSLADRINQQLIEVY